MLGGGASIAQLRNGRAIVFQYGRLSPEGAPKRKKDKAVSNKALIHRCIGSPNGVFICIG